MEAYFYYRQNENGKPFMTNCIAVDGAEYAKGMAYCSTKDNFSRKVGRSIAFERARKALSIKSNVIGKPYIKNGQIAKSQILRAIFMPNLEDHEKKFIERLCKHCNKSYNTYEVDDKIFKYLVTDNYEF